MCSFAIHSIMKSMNFVILLCLVKHRAKYVQCASLCMCVSLYLSLSLCVPYCLTVCFRCDLFRFECMCVCVCVFFAFSAAAVENPLFLFSRMVDCLVCIITYLLFIR